jgi:FlaA1/EpsC-like NDP-sugar epimerase
VPLFADQIARGGPVTVTDPEVKRYFMTIPEAVELVLQASVMGRGGEVFVLDMGQPVRILDLARDLITLSGLRPEIDIPIEITGLRPGEKLFEELVLSDEEHARSSHPKVFVFRNGVNGCRPHDVLCQEVTALVAAARSGDRSDVLDRLRRLVPEYGLAEAAYSQSDPMEQI